MKRPTPEHTPAAIGHRLVLTRQALGFSHQGDFAQRAGLAQSAYSQYETGKKRPSIEAAVALCDAYALTLDWIYRGDPSGLSYELGDAIKAMRIARDVLC